MESAFPFRPMLPLRGIGEADFEVIGGGSEYLPVTPFIFASNSRAFAAVLEEEECPVAKPPP